MMSKSGKTKKKPIRKLSNDELQSVLDLSRKSKRANPTYRKGQLFVNSLKVLFPETADSITATIFDPYYDDRLLDSCIKYLSE